MVDKIVAIGHCFGPLVSQTIAEMSYDLQSDSVNRTMFSNSVPEIDILGFKTIICFKMLDVITRMLLRPLDILLFIVCLQ